MQNTAANHLQPGHPCRCCTLCTKCHTVQMFHACAASRPAWPPPSCQPSKHGFLIERQPPAAPQLFPPSCPASCPQLPPTIMPPELSIPSCTPTFMSYLMISANALAPSAPIGL
jgi:hypothetical protein